MFHSGGISKNIKQESSAAKKCIIAVSFGFLIFIIVLIISSFLIMNILMPTEHLYLFVLLASGLSSISCTAFTCFSQKHRLLFFSMISTAILAIIEFLILLCFNNLSLSAYVYFLFPIVILCSFLSCVLITNVKKK